MVRSHLLAYTSSWDRLVEFVSEFEGFLGNRNISICCMIESKLQSLELKVSPLGLENDF